MSYPYLVQIAWDVIEKFIVDWHQQPFKWYAEADVQAEISSRLRTTYENVGHGYVDEYIEYGDKSTHGLQEVSIVGCNVSLHYTQDGEKKYCRPDIVIWNQLEDGGKDQNENWTALLALELKVNKNDPGDRDIRKLKMLLDQGIVDFACWINIHTKQSEEFDGHGWEKLKCVGRDSKFWRCDIRLPYRKELIKGVE